MRIITLTLFVGFGCLTGCVSPEMKKGDAPYPSTLKVTTDEKVKPQSKPDHLYSPSLLKITDNGDGSFVRPFNDNSVFSKSTRRTGKSFVYQNTQLSHVLNDILAESFKTSFTIDPSVSGTLTLRLFGISTVQEAVGALNVALEPQGLVLIEKSGTYALVRRGNANTDTLIMRLVEPGKAFDQNTNLAILPLRGAVSKDVEALLKSAITGDFRVVSDGARNLLLLSGNPRLVQEAVRLAQALDVNWLNAVSYAVVPLKNYAASDLITDSERLVRNVGGAELVALSDDQSVLVLTTYPESLGQITTLIEQFDARKRKANSGNTLVYLARHLDAEALLQSVSQLFIGSDNASGNNQSTSAKNTNDKSGSNSGSAVNSISVEGVRLSVDKSRNALLARGNPRELSDLRILLEELDNEEPQVLIEVTIVEVTLGDSSNMGIQWEVVEGKLKSSFNDASTGVVAARFPGVSLSYVNTDISAVVNALASVNELEIVSSPRVTTLNNKTARLQVGDQVPVITQTAVSVTDPDAPVVNSVVFRDTGVILEVTPKFRGNGMIEIEVSQEVSAVAETTTSGIDSPTITQRQIESTLIVPNGSTAVLGGLISSTRSQAETGVPYLKDVPALGRLFSATSDTDRRTELVVLLRPTLVDTSKRQITLSERIARAVERLRPELLK